MLTIEDLAQETGLKKPFVGRCLREFKEVFDSLTKNGANNRQMFDPYVLVIFQKIKQYKEEGLTIPLIKEHIFSTYADLIKKPEKELENSYTTTGYKNEKTLKKDKKPSSQADNEVIKLLEKLNEVEKTRYESDMARIQAEKSLEIIKGNLKLLPAGGDLGKTRRMIAIITKLEELTSPNFFRGREAKQLWKELKDILFFDEGRIDEF